MNKLYLTLCIITAVVLGSCNNSTGPGPEQTTTYRVSVSVTPSEAGTISPAAEKTYEEGASISLQATAGDSYRFTHWSGDVDSTAQNPLKLTADHDYALTAHFAKKSYQLTMHTEGQGSVAEKVLKDKSIDYEQGTRVELTATPEQGWRFDHWSGDLSGSDNPAQLAIDKAKDVTAVFVKKEYELTVTTQGQGAVAEEVVKAKNYEYGMMVRLTATAEQGWAFDHWKGDLTGSENPKQLSVDEAKDVTAVFVKKAYELTVTTQGQGAVAEEVVKAKSYEYETMVQLTATAEQGWAFDHWEGALTGSENPKQLSVDKAKEVTAVFQKQSYGVTTATEGQGTIAKTPERATYEYGTSVQLTATPAERYEFVEWTGDLATADNPVQLTIDEAKQVTAVFTKQAFAVSITTEGQGTIIKNPDQATYEYGTSVELTATPAAGYKFTGWSGDVTTTDNPITVTVNKAIQLTATFDAKFTLASNGVTILCADAAIGATDVVNGITYTKRSAGQITEENAETTCTSGIADMKKLFYFKSSFNEDISSWDVSSVTDMSLMFFRASSFNGDISSWDVSSVTDMSNMFNSASVFNGDISNWDVSNVTNTGFMFYGASAFNGNLSSWDVSKVTSMDQMFRSASVFNQNLNGWDVSKVTNMSFMFADAVSFNRDLNSWDVSSVTDMGYMFSKSTAFNGNISSWDVSSVTNMSYMLRGTSSFDQDLSGWCVSQFGSEPFYFSYGSGLSSSHEPNWGTCPAP